MHMIVAEDVLTYLEVRSALEQTGTIKVTDWEPDGDQVEVEHHSQRRWIHRYAAACLIAAELMAAGDQ